MSGRQWFYRLGYCSVAWGPHLTLQQCRRRLFGAQAATMPDWAHHAFCEGRLDARIGRP